MVFTANVYALINYFSQMLWLSVVASIAGLLWLRKTKPDLPRPIKVNIILPIIFIVACLVLVLLPSFSDPTDLVIGILITAAGIPVYYAGVEWKNKPTAYRKVSRAVNRLCLGLFNTMPVSSNAMTS